MFEGLKKKKNDTEPKTLSDIELLHHRLKRFFMFTVTIKVEVTEMDESKSKIIKKKF